VVAWLAERRRNDRLPLVRLHKDEAVTYICKRRAQGRCDEYDSCLTVCHAPEADDDGRGRLMTTADDRALVQAIRNEWPVDPDRSRLVLRDELDRLLRMAEDGLDARDRIAAALALCDAQEERCDIVVSLDAIRAALTSSTT
jgi:hypothetical protein